MAELSRSSLPIPRNQWQKVRFENSNHAAAKERRSRLQPVSEATTADVDAAVAAASAAFPAWSALSPTERGAPMARLADLIAAANDELARLEATSMGKPVSEFFDGGAAAGTFRLYAGMGWEAQGRSSVNTPGYVNLTLRQPYGVVAAIIPWNVPLLFFAKKVAPALAAGNTVVVKSSEKAPLTVKHPSFSSSLPPPI